MTRVDPVCDTVSPKSSTTSRVSTRFLTVVCALLAVSCLALGTYVVHDKMTSDPAELLHHESDQAIDMEYATLVSETKIDENSINITDEDTEEIRGAKVCYTPTCVATAANLVKSLDKTVNPCENFYKFACGNWAKNQDVPQGASMYGVFYKLNKLVNMRVSNLINGKTKSNVRARSVHKVIKFYKSCMDVNRIETEGQRNLFKKIKSLGGFPMINNHWDARKVDVLDLSIKLRAMNVDTLFSQSIRIDYKQQDFYRLHLDEVDQNLGYASTYRSYYKVKRYQKFIEDVAVAMRGSRSVARRDARALVAFEKKLAAIRAVPSQRRSIAQVYKKYTIRSLASRTTSKINWKDYFNKQLRAAGKPDVTDNTVVISWASSTYFRSLMRLVENTPKRTLVNYQMFNLVYKSVGYLGERYHQIIQTYVGRRGSSQPRSKICEHGVSRAINWAVSRMFVEKYFDSSAKSSAVTMIEDVRDQFVRMLQSEPWMDRASSTVAVEKARAIGEHIGYPELIMHNAQLDQLYSKLRVNAREYVSNIFSSWENSYIKNLEKMDIDHNHDIWHLDVTMVNAFYEPLKNRISFPAAILQVPFYHKDYPKYLNYAGIGFVIGHEITHGFDSNGRRYDKNGHKKDWWSPRVVREFKKRAQCYVRQYNKFYVPEVGRYLNGQLTLNENIADNGGIKESFNAYRHYVAEKRNGREEDVLPGLNMSPNQLFFLNTAQAWCSKIYDNRVWRSELQDVHSPGRYRILGIMANSPDFSKAYNCPAGSKMNPVKKCKLW